MYAQNRESVTAELRARSWKGNFLLLLLIRLLLTLCCLRPFYVLLCSISHLRFLWFGALLGTCKNQNPISVGRREINTICMHRIERP